MGLPNVGTILSYTVVMYETLIRFGSICYYLSLTFVFYIEGVNKYGTYFEENYPNCKTCFIVYNVYFFISSSREKCFSSRFGNKHWYSSQPFKNNFTGIFLDVLHKPQQNLMLGKIIASELVI